MGSAIHLLSATVLYEEAFRLEDYVVIYRPFLSLVGIADMIRGLVILNENAF